MELDAVLRERRSMRKYQPDRKVSREQVEETLMQPPLRRPGRIPRQPDTMWLCQMTCSKR